MCGSPRAHDMLQLRGLQDKQSTARPSQQGPLPRTSSAAPMALARRTLREKTAEPRPNAQSFARATASPSEPQRATASTWPRAGSAPALPHKPQRRAASLHRNLHEFTGCVCEAYRHMLGPASQLRAQAGRQLRDRCRRRVLQRASARPGARGGARTGPKTSSRQMRMAGVTPASTVGA
jgi:hypothetical protein